MHSTLDTISGIILILMATTAAAGTIEYLRRKYSPTYRAQAEARDKQRTDTRTDWEREADRRAREDKWLRWITTWNLLFKKRN